MIVLLLLQLQRPYYPVSVAQLAASGTPHTHVEVTGAVTYVRKEADGDLHIRLTSGNYSIIAECIPRMPCVPPALTQQVTVRGISRFDPEHRWWEVHPVEEIR